jgi:hypothetical protein
MFEVNPGLTSLLRIFSIMNAQCLLGLLKRIERVVHGFKTPGPSVETLF